MRHLTIKALVLTVSFWLIAGQYPVPALAIPTLDFGVNAPTSGSISYTGGAAALVGSGISVDNVTGLDTLSNNGAVRNCISCTLAFTTGAPTGAWTWGGTGAGNSITITGTVDLNNNGVADAGDATGTLLTGSFGTAEVAAFGTTFRIAGSSFEDTKNGTLTTFYGLPGGPYDGNFNLSFNATGSSGNAFSSTRVLSGDIANSPYVGGVIGGVPVPEPATLLLLGAGLAGLGLWGRKKISNEIK